MKKKKQIDLQRIPKHVAIIMDGNGRWAKEKGMNRIFGHKNALKAVRESVEGAAKIGINAITLYAFSSENWNRPKLEVDALMSLLISSLKKELATFQNNGVLVNAIGNTENLPKKAQKVLKEVILQTKNNTKIVMTRDDTQNGRYQTLAGTAIMSLSVSDEVYLYNAGTGTLTGHTDPWVTFNGYKIG